MAKDEKQADARALLALVCQNAEVFAASAASIARFDVNGEPALPEASLPILLA